MFKGQATAWRRVGFKSSACSGETDAPIRRLDAKGKFETDLKRDTAPDIYIQPFLSFSFHISDAIRNVPVILSIKNQLLLKYNVLLKDS